MKVCCTCKKEKDISCYHKTNGNKDGLSKQCKSCKHDRYIRTQKESYIRSRKSILQNVTRAKQYQYNYYRKNMSKIKSRANKFYLDNKSKIRDWSRDYMRNKKNTDPNFRLLSNLRTRINCSLKRNSKSAKTMELIGCTIEELKIHLQSQFTTGMSWENRGYKGWHIDHIKPCASFDLSKPEQQKICFHYTNLQPLWWRDNIIKSDKLCA